MPSEPNFPKLNDSNYVDWAYLMEAYLIQKDVWDIVNGNIVHPHGSTNSKAVCTFLKKQQVACSAIILNVEMSQLPHTCYDDPKLIWDNLKKVHQACSFATCLSLHHQFLYMQIGKDQTISSWILDVKNTAYRLSGVSVTVLDDDIILALCEGLPTSYLMLIVTLNSLPPDELTLDNIVTCLLNEEVCQKLDRDEKYPSADQVLVARNKVRQPMSEITCLCGEEKGTISRFALQLSCHLKYNQQLAITTGAFMGGDGEMEDDNEDAF
jgi:hypothetical protein